MTKTFPRDRFDEITDEPERVGAHRAPAPRNRGWIAFAWAALVTGVLVGAGVFALSTFSDSVNFELPFESAAPGDAAPEEPEPTDAVAELDPDVVITVLNGTATTGLANTVGDSLVAAGWGGAAEGVGTRANAAAEDVVATTVFYGDTADEAAARALVDTLGTGQIQLSQDYPQSPIVVLIGSDYAPPAG
ncbi:LytR C-terminal domain-containing protein [Marisediminicola sp. LYQ134]|uniref:LytR C-terminal domain-containing protein n=1 Tax=unclassified Marisediminicola TaxID=2618316 RepID=UPI003983B0AE